MNVLAIDPGSKCGWAIFWDGSIESGVQDFNLKRGESRGMRFFLFRTWLTKMIGRCKPDIVVYEQCHHRGGAATEVLIGMVTRIQEVCDQLAINYTIVHSATLKKFAVGRGGASKEDMFKKATERWGDDIADDNEADALWILEWAKKELNGK